MILCDARRIPLAAGLKPYYESDNITLWNNDCKDVIPLYNELSFDGLITDPPYGINYDYKEFNDTPEGYGAWLWKIIEMAELKLCGGSPVFVFQAMPNCRKFSEWFPRDYRIYAACKNFVQMRKTAMNFAYDPVIVWWTEGEIYSEGSLSRDWYIAQTSPSSFTGDNAVTGHPCPRPIDQMRQIINQWVRPGGDVLDPFAGSGTTLVAAIQLGRRAVGCEISRDYCEIAVKRIKAAEQQMRLF
jgi:DNA modification methylase